MKRDMAEMCVKAVLTVADLKRRDVNLDLIKVLWQRTCRYFKPGLKLDVLALSRTACLL